MEIFNKLFKNMFYIEVVAIYLIFIPYYTHQQTQNESNSESLSYCLQKRTNDDIFTDCYNITENFCSNIQCEPIVDCKVDERHEIVDNITGRGCCPACIEFLDEDENCDVGSKLKKCRNGLFCSSSTKQCNLPGVKNRCLLEYHNRRLVQLNKMKFYVKTIPDVKELYYAIDYADDIEFPVCDHDTGKYELKQCKKSKCFCVDPDNGKYTFGFIEKDLSENVTCKCSDFFQKKLVTGNGGTDKNLEQTFIAHYAQVHAKCDSAGNFEKLQCVNQTCFCVDEKTGRPEPGKAAMYGALSTLPCFDTEKSKLLESKLADSNYQYKCEQQLMRSMSLSLHFWKKGTKLREETTTCSFDGKYGPKQCKPGNCNCVNPLTGSQLTPYATDRQGGKDADMDCKCAREEYYGNSEQRPFDRLQCAGNGNYNAWQCFENGRECFCVDEDGSRISTVFPSNCLDQFIKREGQGLIKEEICLGMRKSLTDRPMSAGKYYKFLKEITDFVEMDSEPKEDQIYSCGL